MYNACITITYQNDGIIDVCTIIQNNLNSRNWSAALGVVRSSPAIIGNSVLRIIKYYLRLVRSFDLTTR